MYHDPEPEVLDRHLEYLARHFNLTTLDVIVDAILRGDWSAVPERAMAVTIDDGHAGNYELLPVFRKHGVRPTIFLCSGIVGTSRRFWFLEPGLVAEHFHGCTNEVRLKRLNELVGYEPEREYEGAPSQALSRQQIAEMSPWVDFQAHTRFHPYLTRCSDAEAWQEIGEGRQELEKMLSSPVRHFAYPGGDHDDRIVGIVRRAGFDSARTCVLGWNRPDTDPHRLHVLPTPDHVDVETLAVTLTGITVRLRSLAGRLRGVLAG